MKDPQTHLAFQGMRLWAYPAFHEMRLCIPVMEIEHDDGENDRGCDHEHDTIEVGT